MDFKVAYTSDESRIASALQSGQIDNGDMVLVTDSTSPYGSLVIINDAGEQVKISTNVRKFENMQLANAWLADKTNPPVGEIISVYTDGKYVLYTINESPDGSFSIDSSAPSTGSIAWTEI